MDEEKKYEVVMSPEAQAQYDALPEEDRRAIDEKMEELARNPRKGELAKACMGCGKHFWHSDGECPFCGWKVVH